MASVPSNESFTGRQLSKLLDEAAISLSREERKIWLTQTSRTVLKKIKAIKAKAEEAHTAKKVIDYYEAQNTGKVEIGDVIDGLQSKKTYHIIAKRDAARISVRNLDDGRFKFKFHPNLNDWALIPEDLQNIGVESFQTRQSSLFYKNYQRVILPENHLEELITRLKRVPGIRLLSPGQISLLLQGQSLIEPPIVFASERHKPAPKPAVKAKAKPAVPPPAAVLKKRPSAFSQ